MPGRLAEAISHLVLTGKRSNFKEFRLFLISYPRACLLQRLHLPDWLSGCTFHPRRLLRKPQDRKDQRQVRQKIESRVHQSHILHSLGLLPLLFTQIALPWSLGPFVPGSLVPGEFFARPDIYKTARQPPTPETLIEKPHSSGVSMYPDCTLFCPTTDSIMPSCHGVIGYDMRA